MSGAHAAPVELPTPTPPPPMPRPLPATPTELVGPAPAVELAAELVAALEQP